MTQIYEIVDQTKYLIELKEIENIEDAGDNFVTYDELREMGIEHCWNGVKTLNNNITTRICEYLTDIKEGNKSIVIDDQELIDVLVRTQRAVSDFVPNTRRVGNRLFKHEKVEKERVVSYNDWSSLINVFEWMLNDLNVIVSIKRNSKRQPSITLFKKMFEWVDIAEYINNHCKLKLDPIDIEMMKQVYDNPELIQEAK